MYLGPTISCVRVKPKSCDHYKLGICPMTLPVWQNQGKQHLEYACLHQLRLFAPVTLICDSYISNGSANRLRLFAPVTPVCTSYACLQPWGRSTAFSLLYYAVAAQALTSNRASSRWPCQYGKTLVKQICRSKGADPRTDDM